MKNTRRRIKDKRKIKKIVVRKGNNIEHASKEGLMEETYWLGVIKQQTTNNYNHQCNRELMWRSLGRFNVEEREREC